MTHLNDTVLTTDTLWADALWVWTAKLMGAVAGSAVWLAYVLTSDFFFFKQKTAYEI